MGLLKVTNKDGNTYVYENHSYWDKELKQSRAHRTLIGKIDPATGDIVPTDGRGRNRGKRRNIRLETLGNMQTRFICAVELMEKISVKCGLLETMEGAFLRSYPLIMSIAYYSLLEKDAEFEFFERWQKTHCILARNVMDRDAIIKLAKYVKKKCDRRSENEYSAQIFSSDFDTEILNSLFQSVSTEEKWKYLQTAVRYVRGSLLAYMKACLPEDESVTKMLLSLDSIGAIKDLKDTFLIGEVIDEQCEYYRLMDVEMPEFLLGTDQEETE